MLELDEEDREQILEGDEYHSLRLVRKYLLSDEHRQWLCDNKLETVDLVRGNWNQEQAPMVKAIFQDWNQKLGVAHFGKFWLV